MPLYVLKLTLPNRDFQVWVADQVSETDAVDAVEAKVIGVAEVLRVAEQSDIFKWDLKNFPDGGTRQVYP